MVGSYPFNTFKGGKKLQLSGSRWAVKFLFKHFTASKRNPVNNSFI